MHTDEICHKKTTCRICGGAALTPVIDLGAQCLASVFEKGDLPPWLARKYPLTLVRCAAPDGCGLVQLGHSIAPHILYQHYGYQSGINERMRQNLLEIAGIAAQMADLKPGDTVCDIGCNDGTLLDSLNIDGLDRLGIDPAENVVALARAKGLDVVCDFFSRKVYDRARPKTKAKLVATIAMFYDLDAPADVVADVAGILADDGVWVMELAYFPFMLKNSSFDAICHEHLSYYCLRQLEWLLDRHHLKIHRLEFNDINGGSIRLFIRKTAAGPVPEETQLVLEKVRRDEQALGLDNDQPYNDFCHLVMSVRDKLRSLLDTLKVQGQTVYAYGASTKGNTILQFCGIDHHLVAKAADRNPDKWSARTPATHIEIISEQQAREEAPDYFLVLPWAFFDAFKKREEAFLESGGRFILPLPEVKVVGKD